MSEPHVPSRAYGNGCEPGYERLIIDDPTMDYHDEPPWAQNAHRRDFDRRCRNNALHEAGIEEHEFLFCDRCRTEKLQRQLEEKRT